MPWQVRIEIRRHPAGLPAALPALMAAESVSVMSATKIGALAKAVAAVLPVADAAMPGLFRELARLRRDALAAGRPSDERPTPPRESLSKPPKV